MINLFKKDKKITTENNNSIFTLNPYRWNRGWVFDDARVGLDKEAFVAGADTMLDKLAGDRDSVSLIFSTIKFPTAQVEVELVETDPTGSVYYCKALDHTMWLCPALFLYYPVAPQKIYFQIK